MSRKRVKHWGEFEELNPQFLEPEEDMKLSITKINQIQEVVRATKDHEAQQVPPQKK